MVQQFMESFKGKISIKYTSELKVGRPREIENMINPTLISECSTIL